MNSSEVMFNKNYRLIARSYKQEQFEKLLDILKIKYQNHHNSKDLIWVKCSLTKIQALRAFVEHN